MLFRMIVLPSYLGPRFLFPSTFTGLIACSRDDLGRFHIEPTKMVYCCDFDYILDPLWLHLCKALHWVISQADVVSNAGSQICGNTRSYSRAVPACTSVWFCARQRGKATNRQATFRMPASRRSAYLTEVSNGMITFNECARCRHQVRKCVEPQGLHYQCKEEETPLSERWYKVRPRLREWVPEIFGQRSSTLYDKFIQCEVFFHFLCDYKRSVGVWCARLQQDVKYRCRAPSMILCAQGPHFDIGNFHIIFI